MSVNSAGEFKTAWNSIGIDASGNKISIDAVELIFHGSIKDLVNKGAAGIGYLIMPDGSKVVASKYIVGFSDKDACIYDLDRKVIDLLYTAVCNSGHLNVDNVAKAFTVNNDIRQSVGWDSGIIF